MTKRKLFSILAALVLALTLAFSATACGESDPEGNGGGKLPTNDDPYCIAVEITSMPTKLAYKEGDIFDPKGLKFDATFMIDGKEEVIEDMTYADCDYTHKGEALTLDVTSIEFDCFTYKFSIDITVEPSAYKSLKINSEKIPANVIAGSTVDLTLLSVSGVYSNNEEVVLDAGSYVLKDNGTEVTPSAFYALSEGKHTFTVEFLELSQSFELTAWNKSDLTVSGLEIDTSALGASFVVQDYVNLDKIKVSRTYTADGGVTVTEEVSKWTITKADGSAITNATSYQLLEQEETFKVTADGTEGTFKITATYYDTMEIVLRDGSEENVATKNSNFATAYMVRLSISGSDKYTEVNPAQYTISATRNGTPVEGATVENVFSEAGEVVVTVTYRGLTESVTVNILDGYVVYSKDHCTTEQFEQNPDYKNFVEIPPGTTIKAQNPNDNGYEYIGDVNSTDVLIFHIWSDVAGKADIIANVSSTVKTNTEVGQWNPTETAELQFNTVFEVFKGSDLTEENKYTVPDTAVVPGFSSEKTAYDESESDKAYYNKFDSQGRAYDPMIWTNWRPVTVGEIDLVPGDNVVTLRYCGGNGDGKVNIYSLELRVTEVA